MTETICIPGSTSGIGGPSSFRHRLAGELRRRGITVDGDLGAGPYRAVLIVSGTKRLAALARHRSRGARIVQRLDGMNWRHRVQPMPTGAALRSRFINGQMRLVRSVLAHAVVYQSDFVRGWWHERHGPAAAQEVVIRNAVDLDEYSPPTARANGAPRRLLCVEGTVQADEVTLESLLAVHRRLVAEGLIDATTVCGRVDEPMRSRLAGQPDLELLGAVEREHVLRLHGEAVLFLCLEINPPCPNAVVEALAAGTPVLGFDTGSLRELVEPGGGVVVPYGGNPWRLEMPSTISQLAAAATRIARERERWSAGARRLAESRYGIAAMADRYLDVLLSP